MKLTETDFGTAVPIDGYGPGFFRVAGEVIEGDLIMLPDAHGVWDGSWTRLIERKADYDVLFIGQGKDIAPLDEAAAAQLKAAGIAFELMSSASACRTYNVLLSEGRRIVAVMKAVA